MTDEVENLDEETTDITVTKEELAEQIIEAIEEDLPPPIVETNTVVVEEEPKKKHARFAFRL